MGSLRQAKSLRTSRGKVVVDEEEEAMFEKIDLIDQERQKVIDDHVAEQSKLGYFKRLSAYNKPAYLIIVGVLGSMVNGAVAPVVGWAFAEILGILTPPMELIGGKEFVKEELTFWVIVVAIAGSSTIFG